MSLLIASDVSLRYGPKVLLDGVDVTLGPHDRVGLVGANGTGKSSLMKILGGAMQPDSAELAWRKGTRVGYLPQDLVAAPEGTVIESVMRSVPGRDALLLELDQVQRALEASKEEAEQLELSEQLHDLHLQVDEFESRFGRRHAEQILLGLGFRREGLDRKVAELSGGWRMRAALAGLLLQDPDLLLLDEPTNHLDVPTLVWFDAFLRASRRALVLISHDRELINRQVSKVWALEVEGLRTYAGNYDEYKRQRAEELEQLRAKAARVERRRAELEAFIERFGAKATKARQAQSRAKVLEKLEQVELVKERGTVHFRFPEVERSGRDVARFSGVRKRFGDTVVYRDLTATVERGQRIAVIGANGAGKTTLLKLLAGELEPDGGEIELGHQVTLGYYAQHHAETLERSASVLEELRSVAPLSVGDPQLRSLLGAFLFSGEDVDKKVGVLSGGERARVALAKLLLRPANLLLLDEPTNHLDLDSAERLTEALRGYGGTLVFVSHHQAFVNALATHVWDVRDGTVVPYPGNLAEYLERQRRLAEAASSRAEEEEGEARGDGPLSAKERRRLEAEERQRRSAVEGPLKKQVAELESRIAELEARAKEEEGKLADPALYDDFARAKPLMDAHRLTKAELEAALQQWEAASAKLEEARR
ncbi:MAG TPA: ABC-F family ATP-binding cassette domain-containing protein [Myxococcales bacterium]|nr:ABC-F family ATP-binding cassette domain-containing protein [Myxococcales bacterium]